MLSHQDIYNLKILIYLGLLKGNRQNSYADNTVLGDHPWPQSLGTLKMLALGQFLPDH